MNERIQELADKSGFGPAWYDPTIPTSDIDRRWIDQRRLKEFAKLIVLECASLFADDLRPMGDFTERACRRAIKEHFGVEE